MRIFIIISTYFLTNESLHLKVFKISIHIPGNFNFEKFRHNQLIAIFLNFLYISLFKIRHVVYFFTYYYFLLKINIFKIYISLHFALIVHSLLNLNLFNFVWQTIFTSNVHNSNCWKSINNNVVY